MTLKRFFVIFLFLLFGGNHWLQKRQSIRFSQQELQSLQPALKPILDIIASGEGDYHSVNRGRAGDSKSSWPRENLGKDITEMTVAELRSHQGGEDEHCWYKGKRGTANLYAVGRYQLIPCTLRLATIQIPDFDMNAQYNQELQDILGVYLILIKRPKIREYLAGFNEDHATAGQELAKEFASVPVQYFNGRCQRGQSYYCNDKAGNAAHIALSDIDNALQKSRATLLQEQRLPQLIKEKENMQSKIRRYWRQLWQPAF